MLCYLAELFQSSGLAIVVGNAGSGMVALKKGFEYSADKRNNFEVADGARIVSFDTDVQQAESLVYLCVFAGTFAPTSWPITPYPTSSFCQSPAHIRPEINLSGKKVAGADRATPHQGTLTPLSEGSTEYCSQMG